jgi:hypothetical protein
MPAGQDATEAFYSLHRHEVLEKPQYLRLRIGLVEGKKPIIHSRIAGELSKVPYAEPTWLTEGYHSPYFTGVCFDHLGFNLCFDFFRRVTESSKEQ